MFIYLFRNNAGRGAADRIHRAVIAEARQTGSDRFKNKNAYKFVAGLKIGSHGADEGA
jgi:hypothetical protein